MAQAIDFFQLIKSPQTYKCNLYKITHDSFFMKKEWEGFVQKLSINVKYFYQHEFRKKYPDIKLDTPTILSNKEDKIKIFISTDEINGLLSCSELISTIANRII